MRVPAHVCFAVRATFVCLCLLWLGGVAACAQQQQVAVLADAPSAVREDHASAAMRAVSPASALESSAAAMGDSVAAGGPPTVSRGTAKELHLESEIDRNTACDSGELRGKPCRVSWPRVLGSSFFFLSAQHGGNVGMDDDARYHLLHHTNGFWGDYAAAVSLEPLERRRPLRRGLHRPPVDGRDHEHDLYPERPETACAGI